MSVRVTTMLEARVQTRRVMATRLGLVAIAFATAMGASACIFEQGEYKGGGRLGKAAHQDEPGEQDSVPTTPTTTSTSRPGADGGSSGG